MRNRTLYDNAHCVGSDIKQGKKATAAVSIERKHLHPRPLPSCMAPSTAPGTNCHPGTFQRDQSQDIGRVRSRSETGRDETILRRDPQILSYRMKRVEKPRNISKRRKRRFRALANGNYCLLLPMSSITKLLMKQSSEWQRHLQEMMRGSSLRKGPKKNRTSTNMQNLKLWNLLSMYSKDLKRLKLKNAIKSPGSSLT